MPILSTASRRTPRPAHTIVRLEPANDHVGLDVAYPTTVRYLVEYEPVANLRPKGDTFFDRVNQAAFDLANDGERADRYADMVGKFGLTVGAFALAFTIARSFEAIVTLIGQM